MHQRFAQAVLPLLASAALGPALAQQQKVKPAPPAATVAGFTVNITYSPKAKETLVARKETVIVFGYLYGSPRQGTPERYIDDGGQVYLGGLKDEIVPGATATFDRIKLNPAMMKWIDSQGTQLNINVASGRKSSPNNLLDCGIYEGSLKAVQGRSIPIACKLIGE